MIAARNACTALASSAINRSISSLREYRAALRADTVAEQWSPLALKNGPTRRPPPGKYSFALKGFRWTL